MYGVLMKGVQVGPVASEEYNGLVLGYDFIERRGLLVSSQLQDRFWIWMYHVIYWCPAVAHIHSPHPRAEN